MNKENLKCEIVCSAAYQRMCPVPRGFSTDERRGLAKHIPD